MIKIKNFENYNSEIGNSKIDYKNNGLDEEYQVIKKELIKDLKIDLKLLNNFENSIDILIPFVKNILKNTKNIEVNKQNTVLTSISISFIIYLEKEKNNDEEKLTKVSKSLLEELRLRGIGNGIIKDIIKSLDIIKNLIAFFYKYFKKDIITFTQLFSLKNIDCAFHNISSIVSEYDMSIENINQNFNNIITGNSSVILKKDIIKLLDCFEELNKSKIINSINFKDDDIISYKAFDVDNDNLKKIPIILEQ